MEDGVCLDHREACRLPGLGEAEIGEEGGRDARRADWQVCTTGLCPGPWDVGEQG